MLAVFKAAFPFTKKKEKFGLVAFTSTVLLCLAIKLSAKPTGDNRYVKKIQFTTSLKKRNCYCLEVSEIETTKLKKNT